MYARVGGTQDTGVAGVMGAVGVMGITGVTEGTVRHMQCIWPH